MTVVMNKNKAVTGSICKVQKNIRKTGEISNSF